ncbi:MAG: hypothetical protein DHS20C02_01320 [Micavibrio sp.]|nr:MAG: hypothetical protein DHS20C02_01320 [Micavibrio sp.]
MAKANKKKTTKTKKSATKADNKTPPQRDTVTGASYDDAPYESYAYPLTHPEHQAVVAKLFGLSPIDLKTARVLELGCGGGGNILPLALDFPNADFVGIDLSPVQIEEANTHKEALGLKNVRFEAMDIMDFDKKMGEFDYIICHGVFSWVPDFVREKILEICDKHLSKNGLACISYNVMPGWAPLRSVREMMMIHTAKFEDPAKKVSQAKYLVEFLDKFMPQGSSMHKAVHNVHEKFKESTNDSYILHEYLESNNNPFYFNEFAEMIAAHKLQYIGDSTLSLMYTGNFPPEAEKALKQVKDMVTKEQYIDFLSNRQFRHSVIKPQGSKTKGADPAVLDELHFSCDLIMEEEKAGEPLTFRRPGSDFSIDVTDPYAKILFREMCKIRNIRYAFKELIAFVVKKSDNAQKQEIEAFLRNNMGLYIFQNIIRPNITPSAHTLEISKKPQAHPLAVYQSQLANCTYVTNISYSTAKPSALEMELLRHLDGTNTLTELTKKMMESIKSGKITINQNNTPVTDEKKQKELLEDIVPKALKNIAKMNLMVG